ncbi:MAG: bifunctional DNA-formamidopyrimidine glycosylase/DNA-(apurinic or apyrimidinic site) lyase [Ostreibacterium sp.]
MPELPEVETTVKGLKYYTEGKKIQQVKFHRDKIRYRLDPSWIVNIRHQTIQRIIRRAKLIIMHLDEGVLLWHLGMTGSMRVSQVVEARRKHDHIELFLSDNRILRFHDPRRFGYLKWFTDEVALYASISHYGVEPLSEIFDSQYLWRKSRHKQQAVKNFIMEQRVVVGVGNIYACEALFVAGIKPQVRSGTISQIRWKRLVIAIKTILQQAIEQGGTTLKDFENAEAKPGYFQQFLSVYGRVGEPCLVCDATIKSIKLGGRSSFYCPQCQK